MILNIKYGRYACGIFGGMRTCLAPPRPDNMREHGRLFVIDEEVEVFQVILGEM